MAERAVPPPSTPRHANGVTVYETGPPRSVRRYLLALLVIAGLLSLVAVPIGWWLAGWPGSLAGAGLAVLVFSLPTGKLSARSGFPRTGRRVSVALAPVAGARISNRCDHRRSGSR